MDLAAAMTEVFFAVVCFFGEGACEISEDERETDVLELRDAMRRDLHEAQNQPRPSASASAAERYPEHLT